MRRVPFAAAFAGRVVVVVASGPSLTLADVNACRGRAAVIVVNDNWRRAPWADALYAADPEWWDHHRGVTQFRGMRVTQDKGAAERWGLHHVHGRRAKGFALKPGHVHWGDNSGYQSIDLAFGYGARRVVLLGFDMQSTGGKSHWFGDHPPEIRRQSALHIFAANFDEAARLHPELDIINASRETALTCWPRMPIEQALA